MGAMLAGQLSFNDVLLAKTFSRFDRESTGCLSQQQLCHVLGKRPELDDSLKVLLPDQDGRLSFEGFAAAVAVESSGDLNLTSRPLDTPEAQKPAAPSASLRKRSVSCKRALHLAAACRRRGSLLTASMAGA